MSVTVLSLGEGYSSGHLWGGIGHGGFTVVVCWQGQSQGRGKGYATILN